MPATGNATPSLAQAASAIANRNLSPEQAEQAIAESVPGHEQFTVVDILFDMMDRALYFQTKLVINGEVRLITWDADVQRQ